VGSSNEALFGGLAAIDALANEPDCDANPDDSRCQQQESDDQ